MDNVFKVESMRQNVLLLGIDTEDMSYDMCREISEAVTERLKHFSSSIDVITVPGLKGAYWIVR